MTTRIRISIPRGETWEEKLEHDATSIGRGEQCHVRITNGTLSRKHATISKVGPGKYWIRDEGSHNGVVLAGQAIRQDTPMDPLQTFWLGDVSIRLILDEEVDHTARLPDGKVGSGPEDITSRLPQGKISSSADISSNQTLVEPDGKKSTPIILQTIHQSQPTTPPPQARISPPPVKTVEPPPVDLENKTVLYDEGEAEYVLEVVSGPQSGSSREAAAADLVIGRDSDCDHVLGDVTVSRRHAIIGMREGVRTIALHQEASGKLYINGRLCTSQPLNHNDRIRLGKTQIIYRLKNPNSEGEKEKGAPSIQVTVTLPQSPLLQNRLVVLGGAALLVVGLLAFLLIRMDPFDWFRSEMAMRLEKLAALEKKGAYFQAADGYQELLSQQKKLSEEEKVLLFERKGHALFSHAFNLLESPTPLEALTPLEESFHSFTLISSPEKRGLEDRIFTKLMGLSDAYVQDEEVGKSEFLSKWLDEHIPRFKESSDYKKMVGRQYRLSKSLRVQQDAKQLTDAGRIEDSVILLDHCLAETAPQDAPCQRGMKETARLSYERSQLLLTEMETAKEHFKGKTWDEAVRLLELAARWDKQNSLYQNALEEVKSKKKNQQSGEVNNLPKDDGFVVDKFRR